MSLIHKIEIDNVVVDIDVTAAAVVVVAVVKVIAKIGITTTCGVVTTRFGSHV